ncbi:MAG: HAD hydrolase-like protein [Nevskia sp.]|nr:HAD hydrolase-like protein [Nevskia sp.]
MNVLLDLDGTLTDSQAGILACVRHALNGIGQPALADAFAIRHIGPPLHVTLAQLLGPAQQHRIDEAIALYRERYAATGLFENAVYEGIPEALEALRAMGARLYLATSKPYFYARQVLEHFSLGGYFAAAYGAELDGTHSDKAQLIAHILARESLAPDTTVMVGDRAQDMRGALANGVRPVGALWGYGTREELAAAGAAAFVERPAHLARALAPAAAS